MRLTVVGSGTAAPEAERVCPGYLIESASTRALLDCGPGVVHHLARFRLPWQELDHVFLSHFHNDHTGDLPMLLFALKWGIPGGRRRPLTVWGPAGVRQRMQAMAGAYGDHVMEPGFPLSIRTLAPGEVALAGALAVATVATPHTDESLAFRIAPGGDEGTGPGGATDPDGPVIGYTGDTGPSAEVAAFLAGADLLVAECSLPEDEAKETHLTPTSLAALARAAGPARLLVTHVYPQLADRDVPALVRAAGYNGAVERARDGLRLDVGPVDAPAPSQ